MKQLELTKEAETAINSFCDYAFRKLGLESYAFVKQLEAWLATAVEVPDSKPSPQPPSEG